MTTDPTDELAPPWRAWHEQRPGTSLTHFDTAAAGRCSSSAQRAVAEHARREAEIGAYIAEAEAAAVLQSARSDLGGLLGVPPDGVAFVESATAAQGALLRSWPLREGDAVAIVGSEWGPNLAAFADRGLRLTELRSDANGGLDLAHLERVVASDPPAAVHLTQVCAHRALTQPISEAAALCRTAGVPLWVDAAQALGHVDTACGADAVYATSRKWMCGPRGVGVLGIAPQWWPSLQVSRYVLAPSDEPTVRGLDSHDAHIAGRVGLAAAVRQFLAVGAPSVWRRLEEVGRLTRAALAELPSWQVVDEAGAPSAITAVRPSAGQDLAATQARLLAEHSILTTVSTVARAPRELTTPLLRISPHVDCTTEQLSALRRALAAG
ncbi:MAG: aminotransferase class V-fold PLP-dependent enzyme [Actinomycetota bacterium]|nr:aminotransferase class V-fold PLP-dependent enzyme [Actinomycetota bacterium]